MTKVVVQLNNISVEELKCKCGCNTFNYDNDYLIRLGALRILANMPFIFTSGCRCKNHNHNEGGEPTSLHECTTKKASASDVTCKNCLSLYTIACKSGLFNEVIYYKKKNFVHLGFDKKQTSPFFQIKS